MTSRRTFLKRSAALSTLALTMQNITTSSVAGNETPINIETIPSRSTVPDDDTWDLTQLFPNDEAWKQALDAAMLRLNEFKVWEGKLVSKHPISESVAECFRLEDSIGMEIERLSIYAYLRYSEDVADPQAQQMQGLTDALLRKYQEAASFILPEILDVFPKDALPIDGRSTDLLDPYRLKLTRIFRKRPHILPKGEEQILAMLTEVSQTASKAFGLLNDADLTFGSVTDETGKSVELTTGSFAVLMNSTNREVRKTAFKQFYAGYESHQNTLASLLGSSIQQDVFSAKARKHSSSLESALFYPEIPRVVYDNLVQTVNKSLPILHRYYDLRCCKMNLDTIHMYDTYVPILGEVKTNYSWEEGVKIISESLMPLGEEYVKVITEGITVGRWCDRYENKGKRSGAFCYGNFSVHPYILINYKPAVLNSLFTLTHEAGHAMHSFYSARSQPYTYYDYVTFVAEVASTFNEDLLSRYLLSQTEDKNMRAYLINRQIDGIRQTLFRQTMFAEFEQQTHEAAESGKPLTATSLRAMYRKLLEAYFGPQFTLDEELETECFRVPHFYRAFYVYQYATGISAALSLADRVSTGGDRERDDYLRFLSGGCSATPIELLRTAGVDMESPLPIETAVKRFEQLVNELETLI